ARAIGREIHEPTALIRIEINPCNFRACSFLWIDCCKDQLSVVAVWLSNGTQTRGLPCTEYACIGLNRCNRLRFSAGERHTHQVSWFPLAGLWRWNVEHPISVWSHTSFVLNLRRNQQMWIIVVQ